MTRYRWALAIAVTLAAAALAVAALRPSQPEGGSTTGSSSADLIAVRDRLPAPELTGIDGWINSPPLAMGGLRNRVVLVDFWTFSCVNCVRTFPHLHDLQSRYGTRGLTLIGVHSPEFDFEKVAANVEAAVTRDGVSWPVALDPEMATWNAYGNQYWPAEYLVDQRGRIAYVHFGEGAYEATEAAVRALLHLDGASPSAASTEQVQAGGDQTPELYAGSNRGILDDGERYGPPGQPVSYPDHGGPSAAGHIEVAGTWADHGEYLQAISNGHVRLRFHAGKVFIVVGSATGSPLVVGVAIDGAVVGVSERGAALGPEGLAVGAHGLYEVIALAQAGDHVVDLTVPAGFRLFAFTFG